MSALKEKMDATVRMLKGGPIFQRKLRCIGLREGKVIKILARQPFGGPIVVQVDGRSITLGRHMARKIVVEVV